MRKKGFTLVEIMVVVAIISVISAGILTVAIRSLHAYYTLSALNELNNNASFAMDEIVRDLREAGIVEVNSDGSMLICLLSKGHDETDFQAIIYYPFTTQDGIRQLRKYVYYNVDSEIDLSQLISSFDPTVTPERVLVNYILTEEFKVVDNNVSIELFLQKNVAITQRIVDITLNSTATLRNQK